MNVKSLADAQVRRMTVRDNRGVHDDLTYDAAGATRVHELTWTWGPPGYRRYQSTTLIGQGRQLWEHASAEVLAWGVKTQSGFSVQLGSNDDLRVAPGQDRVLAAHLGPCTLSEISDRAR